MTSDTTIACGTGYLGDRTCAALALAAEAAVDVVVFEALAEATMGTFALYRRGGHAGFSTRFFDRMAPAIASLVDRGIEVVTSAGICDPPSAGRYLHEALGSYGVAARVLSVTGDELAGPAASHPEGAEHIGSFAYLGATDLQQAIGAREFDVLVTGRVTDTALYMLPLLRRYPNASTDVIAHWAVAGHLAECAGHITGGNYSGRGWRNLDYTRLGHGVVQAGSRPSFTIAPMHSLDGFVDSGTVSEQLLYETGDPRRFMTPDVVADFTAVRVEPRTTGGVRVAGVRGASTDGRLRALSYFLRGEIIELEVAYGWPDAQEKALRAADIVLSRCERVLGPDMPEPHVSVVGATSVFGGTPPGLSPSTVEARARMAFRVADEAIASVLLEEVGSLYDCGPPGACDIAGPTVGNTATSRPWIDVIEAFVPRDAVDIVVHSHAA